MLLLPPLLLLPQLLLPLGPDVPMTRFPETEWDFRSIKLFSFISIIVQTNFPSMANPPGKGFLGVGQLTKETSTLYAWVMGSDFSNFNLNFIFSGP